jgi:hypothetical protein
MEGFFCRHCSQPITMTLARQRSYNYICNGCANRHRDSDVCRYIARKLADSLRRKGHPGPYPGVAFVRQVVTQCNGKSVLSGQANPRHLCILFVNPEAGCTLDNAVLVTSTESYAISRSEAVLGPGHREVLMQNMRIVDE